MSGADHSKVVVEAVIEASQLNDEMDISGQVIAEDNNHHVTEQSRQKHHRMQTQGNTKKMLQQSINDLFSRKSSKSSQAKRKKLKESTSDESEWEDTQTNMVDILSDQVNDKLAPMIEQIVSVAVAKCLDTVMQEHRDALTKHQR